MEQKNLNFKLGIHPINWVGEDVKEHGEYYTYQQVLDDILLLNLTGTEMSRKFPSDKAVLKKELASRGIRLVSQWKSVSFADPSYREVELEAYRKHAHFLSEMGCEVISTAEVGTPHRGMFEKEVHHLDDDQWKWFTEGLHMAGEIAKQLGMKLTYHHHGGTVVEQAEEIDRLMEMTDPNLVYLLYDTGHAFYGGSDPLKLLQKYYDRIAYIHFKDVRQSILDVARAQGANFLACIRKGVFTVPGDGSIDFAPILKELIERGYDGWILLEGEQDPSVNNPFELAKKAIEYIKSLT